MSNMMHSVEYETAVKESLRQVAGEASGHALISYYMAYWLTRAVVYALLCIASAIEEAGEKNARA